MRLRTGWRVVELEERLRRVQEELRRAAMRDRLTGILNRRAILEQLEWALARARRPGESLGVLMIDLDGFKQCNEVRGHLKGDVVLADFASRVRGAAMLEDLLGRYGGVEFLLVAPGCSGASLAALAERIRRSVASEPFSGLSEDLRLTASIGAADTTARKLDAAWLVRAADEALYAAKDRGAKPCGNGSQLIAGPW